MRRRLFNFLDNIRDTLVRILISIAGALFVALATIVLLDPDSVRDFIDSISLLWRLLVLAIIYGVAGWIVYQEFVLGGRGNSKGLRVKGGDNTELDVASVQKKVRETVQNVSGVSDVSATVKSVRGKAEISLSVTMQHESVNIPDKQQEISKALHQLTEKQLGIRVADKPHIELTFGGSGRRSTTPQSTKPPQDKNVDDKETRGPLWNRAKAEPKPDSSVDGQPNPTSTEAKTATNEATLEQAKAEKPPNPLEAEASEDDEDPEFWSFLRSAEKKNDSESDPKS